MSATVRTEPLILVDLNHHLVLKGTLQLLVLLRVVLLQALDVLLGFHLRVVLLLAASEIRGTLLGGSYYNGESYDLGSIIGALNPKP